MEFKGTKTQWLKSENSIGFVYALNKKNESNIFSLNINNDGKVSDEEIESNAKLIASAPEMFEMLKDVLEIQKNNFGNGSNTHMLLYNKSIEIQQLLTKINQ